MKMINESSVLDKSDYFLDLFENRPSKIIAVTSSVVLNMIYLPILYSIIWYEKFGSDKKRTVLNKLVSSICWSSICYAFFCQIPLLIRYCKGPLPLWMCYFHIIVSNTITIQLMLFSDAITVLRYLFIFWLKNPSGFWDDFWTSYLNKWIFMFGLVSQIIHVILPGNFLGCWIFIFPTILKHAFLSHSMLKITLN